MTEAQKREAESIALAVAQTGYPLIVPPSLYSHLERSGVDMSNMRPNTPIPRG